MIKWLHHLFNPHCEECRNERQDEAVCLSCETLKLQLEIANHEKEQLLEAILKPQSFVTQAVEKEVPQQVKPHSIPWAVRKQMLEAEDRQKARIINAKQEEAAKLASSGNIEELEKELGVGG